MSRRPLTHDRGPFHAEQLRSGDPYELSRGHPILVEPATGRRARAIGIGISVLSSDPAVESAGVDTGYALEPDTLRAPDIAIGNVPDEPGWVSGAPPLAVEYVDAGRDEVDLATKIRELLAAGTRFVWVVRLTGPRRVEVHAPDREMVIVGPSEELVAPGILRNPVPIEALYDREAGRRATLRNLLQREGYKSLDAVRAEGDREGALRATRSAVMSVVSARGLPVTGELRAAVEACGDLDQLRRWLDRAVTAGSAAEIVFG